jgi:NADPH:quinone reductase-like Zn-dependent oxidoreductase
MQAIVQDRYGSSEVLQAREIDLPAIGDTDVLVRVRAAGVNPADWAIMHGLPYIARPVYGLRRPKNPVRGTDVAGIVEAVGARVTRFKSGDEVFGWADGSYAEFAAAPQDKLAFKPVNLGFDEAAAVPMAGLVALQALRDRANLQPGQRILVNGASGGIGTFAVQIAKSLGADVTAVTSTGNVDLVRSIGADVVIDYTREDFTRNGQHYDVVLDNVSNHSLSDLRRALTTDGMLIPNGGRFDKRWLASGGRIVKGVLMFRFGTQTLGNFLMSTKHDDLVALKDLIEAGNVMPVMDRAFPLSATAEAIDHVGRGHARGKVVVTVPDVASARERPLARVA